MHQTGYHCASTTTTRTPAVDSVQGSHQTPPNAFYPSEAARSTTTRPTPMDSALNCASPSVIWEPRAWSMETSVGAQT
eukprot:m.120014 g.120014  ORF g.120014 m.120014 type:complete len:78 (-) comp13332_c0_seq3:435-668(-)